jgi:hypothetical protein
MGGSPVPQGGLLLVAVEGYVSGQPRGGVLVDVAAPGYGLFDEYLKMCLPLVRR